MAGVEMRRLHLQILVALLLVLLTCAAMMAVFYHFVWTGGGRAEQMLRAGSHVLLDGIAPGDDFEAHLRARAEPLGLDVSVWDASLTPLARVGVEFPPPLPDSPEFQWRRGASRASVLVRHPDGRWVAMASLHEHHGHQEFPVLLLLLIGLALGTYPIARRITRRLEHLRSGVERLGQGELGARVDVDGQDEVAELARAFNESADRIQALVEQQKRMLASASHELRAPLTRLRLTLELLGDDSELSDVRRDELRVKGEQDIDELDALVADVLLAARLERAGVEPRFESVDLGELAQEVAAELGVKARIQGVRGAGNAAMLRRMLRNLIDNARRHGGGVGVELYLEVGDAGATLVVLDRGPGVPEEIRERIFEPFYRPQGHAEGRDGGVGLGLSLVRQVAEHHGGTARCLARAGGGSRFEVHLPGFA